jgi:hypothetical protein
MKNKISKFLERLTLFLALFGLGCRAPDALREYGVTFLVFAGVVAIVSLLLRKKTLDHVA